MYSSIAQSVEHSAVNRSVVGSSPTWGVFLCLKKDTFLDIFSYIWLRGQAVKTSPFHGGNTGSIPVGVTTDFFSFILTKQRWLIIIIFAVEIA